MAETRLVLVRHGESVVTVDRRIGGLRTCTGLSPLGVRQAEALRNRWTVSPEIEPDVLVASTMPRARQTAEIVAPALGGGPILAEPDVCEHDPGEECDGMSFDEFVERFGTPDWEADPYRAGFPGGETIADFHHRTAAALHRLVHEHAERTVVVFCHGGVIDIALRSFLQMPMVGGFELFTKNTAITELARGRRHWRLERYNDAAHLMSLVDAPDAAPWTTV